MKIVRSKGVSYTGHHESQKLGRGMRLTLKGSSGEQNDAHDSVKTPDDLPAYLKEDPDLLLRQVVSVLDKVIRKPGHRRKYCLGSYVHRTKLSEALWVDMLQRYTKGADNSSRDAFKNEWRPKWEWKIHPYLRDECDWPAPETDKNADYFKKLAEDGVAGNEEEFHGRWHEVFWETNANGPDYAATAAKIMSHLLEQELTIKKGEPRVEIDLKAEKKQETGKGFIEARGLAIASSVHDPRKDKAECKTIKGIDDASEALNVYFSQGKYVYAMPDIAEAIFAERFAEAVKHQDGDQRFYPRKQHSKAFGSFLYEHMGRILNVVGDDKSKNAEELKSELWRIHNKTRQFYQNLSRSTRFETAFESGDVSELGKVLPDTAERLKNILFAKQENADLQELIRLGKLVAHASERAFEQSYGQAPKGETLESQLKEYMDYFVTSDGQSEIKRKETFNRVWRTSVAMSLRTLRTLSDGAYRVEQGTRPDDDDVTSFNAAQTIVARINDTESARSHYTKQLPILFGEDQIVLPNSAGGTPEKTSRTSLLMPSGEVQNSNVFHKEVMWGLLRIASNLRHKTNHFSTLNQMVKLLKKGVIDIAEYEGDNDNRNNKITPQTSEVFKTLLSFDFGLQRKALEEDLGLLQVDQYFSHEQRQLVVEQCSRQDDDAAIMLPRFMGVMHRLRNVYQFSAVDTANIITYLGQVNLDNSALTVPGPEKVRTGTLRLLYNSGFRTWLAPKWCNREAFKAVVDELLKDRDARAKQFNEERGLHYVNLHSRIHDIVDDLAIVDLATLFSTLAALSMGEERLNQTYRANAKKQIALSNQIEDFKKDVIGHFFCQYLEDTNLAWVLTDNIGPRQEKGVTGDLASFQSTPTANPFDKPWHAHFYAWLYLVPLEQVSALRHQFRKTMALETKAHNEADSDTNSILGDMDKLMGLYTRVQQTGFNGHEHEGSLVEGNLNLFDVPELYGAVFAHQEGQGDVVLPRVRRGLRQVLRFGSLGAIQGIYEKHKISAADVEAYRKSVKAEAQDLNQNHIGDLVEKQTKLMKIIRTGPNSKIRDPFDNDKDFKAAVADYKTYATEIALHNMNIRSARLEDHVRTHNLMMKVVARLLDYTITWERDSYFCFLGMLYRKLTAEGAQKTLLSVFQPDEVAYGLNVLKLPEGLAKKIHVKVGGSRHVRTVKQTLNDGFIPLSSDEMGYELGCVESCLPLLDDANANLYRKHFVEVEQACPKDIARRDELRKAGKRAHDPHHWKGRKAIRNDFAHFNMLGGRNGRGINLTFATNAVRSLLSYDRKLKNAVSKSIADILEDEGLIITWTMNHDRLRNPLIFPALSYPLEAWTRGGDRNFALSRVSPRYVSMAKALFDHRPGGYFSMLKADDTEKRKQARFYKDKLAEHFLNPATGEEDVGSLRWIYAKSGSENL